MTPEERPPAGERLPTGEPPPTGEHPPIAEALRLAQAGMVLVAPMLGLGALGYWLDGRFATGPWLMVAGLLLGMVGGFVNFLQTVLPGRPPDGGKGDR